MKTKEITLGRFLGWQTSFHFVGLDVWLVGCARAVVETHGEWRSIHFGPFTLQFFKP